MSDVLSYLLFFCSVLSVAAQVTLSKGVEEEMKREGERELYKVVQRSQDFPCWERALSQVNSSCKNLSDTQMRKLAVTFANCHLLLSGRTTYTCDESMTVAECTGKMDDVAFDTYTEFFTHVIHICFFIHNELWQEKTENIILQLSRTSSETVKKLVMSLEQHKLIEKKQTEILSSFGVMEEMTMKQRDLLWEVYSSLKNSVDGIRHIMSLFLIELVGIETFVFIIVAWVIILFLPKVGYSRLCLFLVLISEQLLETVIRRVYGKLVPSPDDVVCISNCWNHFLCCFNKCVLHYTSKSCLPECSVWLDSVLPLCWGQLGWSIVCVVVVSANQPHTA